MARSLARLAYRALAVSVAAAALTACRVGELDVPIGSNQKPVLYIAPDGDDANAGTRARPWKTFERAAPELAPGTTLVLADGDYTSDSSGLLRLDCSALGIAGTDAEPILIRAASERRASIHGDGERAPLELQGCHGVVLEGLVLTNQDAETERDEIDVGTIAMVHHAENVTLRRVLLSRPNTLRHSHVLRVVDSVGVLIEECEAYDFHHNAFEAVRSTNVTIRRNYLHSRFAQGDNPAWGSPDRGDVGILIEEGIDNIVENNVVEVVDWGIAVVGRPGPGTTPATTMIAGNRVLGNVVRDATGTAFRVESRCAGAAPCPVASFVVQGTELRDNVALQAGVGFGVDGAPGTVIERGTVFGGATGVLLELGEANVAQSYDAWVFDTLVANFSAVGFAASGASEFLFDHCATAGAGEGAPPFAADAGHVVEPLELAAAPSCALYAQDDGPLRGRGASGGDIGASVRHRYEQGELGGAPLWDAQTGAFSCGAVLGGINDDGSQSCSGVHERLGLGTSCVAP